MENKSTNALEKLLDTKSKKKEPSKIERDQFLNAWVELAVSEGYTDRVEQYLYNGVSYCGAKPFKKYLEQLDDQEQGIQLFFKGKMYGANAEVTFRLLVNLLALLMSDKKMVHLSPVVIKRFPGACLNKEKKQLHNAETILRKYFFKELSPSNELTPLLEMGFEKQKFITEFATEMEALIVKIDSSKESKNIQFNIEKVKKWINEYYQTKIIEVNSEKASTDKQRNDTVNDNPAVVPMPMPSVDTAMPTDAPATTATANGKQVLAGKEHLADAVTLLTELLSKASEAVILIESEKLQQNLKIDVLTQKLERKQEKLQRAGQQITDQQAIIGEMQKKLSTAEADIFVLRQDVAQRDAVIAEKDAEIAEKVKMVEILSRDKSKQADESLQRIASKIKVEYQDFKAALDVPMSCDLGENLRFQLETIFNILEKSGMKFKGGD